MSFYWCNLPQPLTHQPLSFQLTDVNQYPFWLFIYMALRDAIFYQPSPQLPVNKNHLTALLHYWLLL